MEWDKMEKFILSQSSKVLAVDHIVYGIGRLDLSDIGWTAP